MARSAVRNSRFDPDTDPFARRDAAHQLRSESLAGGVKWILAIVRRGSPGSIGSFMDRLGIPKAG